MLNVNKATGSDGIPARLLRETADNIALHLQSFSTSPFNMVLYPMNGRLLMSFLYTRKAGRIVWKIIDLFHYCDWSQKYLNVAYSRM